MSRGVKVPITYDVITQVPTLFTAFFILRGEVKGGGGERSTLNELFIRWACVGCSAGGVCGVRAWVGWSGVGWGGWV